MTETKVRAVTDTSVDGWRETGFDGYAEYSRNDKTITIDPSDGLTTEERTSGYTGYTSTVWVPMSVLRALLGKSGLHIVSESERKVLQACDELDRITILQIHGIDHDLGNALLARRGGTGG